MGGRNSLADGKESEKFPKSNSNLVNRENNRNFSFLDEINFLHLINSDSVEILISDIKNRNEGENFFEFDAEEKKSEKLQIFFQFRDSVK